MKGSSENISAGSWPSSLSAEHVAQGLADYMELKSASVGVVWSVNDPRTGVIRLWYGNLTEGAYCLTPEGFSVRSKVNEYGGGSFAVQGHQIVFVNEADQQIYWQPLSANVSEPRALTQKIQCRYADMDIAPCGHYLVAIEEDHSEQSVHHRLVQIEISKNLLNNCCSPPVTVQEGLDFYSSPRISPNGQRLLWVGWNRPHQPWTQTQLYYSDRVIDTYWGAPILLGGEEGKASLQQPLFDQNNYIVVLNDQDGFWQPWREKQGVLQKLPGINADHAGAPWQMGGCNFLIIDQRYLLVSWFEQGIGRLGVFDLHTEQLSVEYLEDHSRKRHLAMDEHFFYCIASHVSQGSAVMAIDRLNGQVHELQKIAIDLTVEEVSVPQPLTFSTLDGGIANAFFYPPKNLDYFLSCDERPPLIVFMHGGPTSAAYPVFDPRIQFWTQRGFAVADLNYRGSTGFGRLYRECLAGRWGELEIIDVFSLLDELQRTDRVNAERLYIRGGSAGGYSSMLAIAFSDRFAAAASWYGVSDPLTLEQVTHKFESDYLSWLLGPLTDSNRHSIELRSPLFRVEKMKTPMIFFQGKQDVVVLPEQTYSIVSALRKRGHQAVHHEFPDQGHGFRCVSTIAFALKEELAFYQCHAAVSSCKID